MSAARATQWVLGARSETGYVRAANEDRMGFTRTSFGNIYVVSDGMGGYRGGALAAELTVSTLQQKLAALSPVSASFREQVRDAFVATNKVVFDHRSADDPDTRNMGATGVVLVTSGARALVGHVGDSRAYLFQHRDRRLRQLTRDHTRVQQMIDAGVMTAAQAAEHPDSSTLDRAIGHQPTVESDVSAWIELKPRDMILLCSDGLSGYVDDTEIGRVMRSKGSPQDLADKLVGLALSKGGEDNVTVQLVRLGGSSGAPWWERLSRPTIVAPATMAASAAVVWGLAVPQIETADARIAELQKQLEASNRLVVQLQRDGSESRAVTASLALQLKGQTQANAATAASAPIAPAPAPKAAGPSTKLPVAKPWRTEKKSLPQRVSVQASPDPTLGSSAAGVSPAASAVSVQAPAPASGVPAPATTPVNE